MSFHHWRDEDLVLDVYIQPRASRDQIAGLHGSSLKIRITAPPVDGAANQYLCKFIAKLFGVPASRVSVIHGASGRHKRLCISKPAKPLDEVMGCC